MTITVNAVNDAPVAVDDSYSVDEDDALIVAAPGASINQMTGAFAWTPTVAQVGTHAITVRVTDNGSPALSDYETILVNVHYGVCALYDETKSHKQGSTIPVKLNLCDAAGNNLSSPDVVIQASNLVKLSGAASPFMAEDSGNANPDNNFRFAGGSYIFNMSTKSSYFTRGQWGLTFVVWVNGVPTASDDYVVTFYVK